MLDARLTATGREWLIFAAMVAILAPQSFPGVGAEPERAAAPAIYGPEFAALFDSRWDVWARGAWARLAGAADLANGRGRRWLDLCCGTGALLRLAVDRGFAAVGVDGSPHQLAHAAQKAPQAGLIEGDIRDLSLPQHDFDIITCMFDSLNYVTALRDLDRVFRMAARCLRPGGLFAFDVKSTAGFRAERNRVLRDVSQVTIFERSYDERRQLHRLSITGFAAEDSRYRRFDEVHVQRGYDTAALLPRLAKAGLRVRCRDFDSGAPARATSRRVLYLCTTPSSGTGKA